MKKFTWLQDDLGQVKITGFLFCRHKCAFSMGFECLLGTHLSPKERNEGRKQEDLDKEELCKKKNENSIKLDQMVHIWMSGSIFLRFVLRVLDDPLGKLC